MRASGDGFDVTLTAQHPALYTWLELGGGATFSDNFVDLQAGQSRTIHVTPAQTMGRKAFTESLSVQSLYDTYQ